MPRVALDFLGRGGALPPSREEVHRVEAAAGDARDDRDRVSVPQGRGLLLQVPDVLVVHVYVHEVPEAAVVVEEVPPQLAETADEPADGPPPVVRGDLPAAAGSPT